MTPRRGKVLGTWLDLVDYQEAVNRVDEWAAAGGVRLVAAANTHLVAEASRNDGFAQVLASFDMVVPDGMPLVWALQMDGCEIEDRVYGPLLMERCLSRLGSRRRHAFVGGTAECLERLQEAARRLNPGIQIAGVISPPFGVWDDAVDETLAAQIHALHADVVWLALGGVRQETWLARNRHRLADGVYLAVGDAFALVAGLRPYAPSWMQRAGLTWLFRLIQEPRRLAVRYLAYNSRFLAAFLRDRWMMAHRGTKPAG